MKLTTMDSGHHRGSDAGNGAASDDRRNGFERGGWARGKGDKDTATFINQTYQRADALPARPADLRAVRRLVGGSLTIEDVPGWGARLAGVGHPAQVRGIDHPRRSGVVGHHRPVR